MSDPMSSSSSASGPGPTCQRRVVRAPGLTAASGVSTLLQKECPRSKVPGVLSIIPPNFRKQRNQGQWWGRGARGRQFSVHIPGDPLAYGNLLSLSAPALPHSASIPPSLPSIGCQAFLPTEVLWQCQAPSMTDQPPCLPGNSQHPQTHHDLQKSTHSCVCLLKCY